MDSLVLSLNFEELLYKAQYHWAEWSSGALYYRYSGTTAYIVTDTRNAFGEGSLLLYRVEDWAQRSIENAMYSNTESDLLDLLEPYLIW